MISAAQRSALAAVGGRVDSPLKRKKLKARQMPKNAVRTHRQPARREASPRAFFPSGAVLGGS